MTTTAPALTPRRARVGVSLMFFTNGAIFIALLPRYPEVKDSFGLSNTAFGLLVVSFAAGAIVAAPFGGALVRRLGTRWVALAGSLAIAAAVMAASFSPSVVLFAVALAIAGAADAVVDAAQNVQAVAVERWTRRSIMNSFHAVWSLGAATGGGVGALGAAYDVGLGWQSLANGLVWGAVAVLAFRWSALPEGAGAKTPPPEPAEGELRRSAPWRLLAPLVAVALFGASVEDIANNWSVLFVRRETDAAAAYAAVAVTVTLVFQVVGRVVGDPMTDRWGRTAVARAGGLLIAVGGLLVVLSGHWWVVLLGFGLGGFGGATLIPAAFAAADDVPGLAHGSGIAALGWLLRIGFLVSSPLVGVVSDASSLRVAMVLPVVAGLGAAALAGSLRRPAANIHGGSVA